MILFFLLPLWASPVFSSSEKLSCFPGDFDVDLSDGRKAHVDGAEVRIHFQRDNVRVNTNPINMNGTMFQISETILIFKGSLSIENSGAPPQIIDQEVNFQMNGVGQLEEHQHKTKLTNCQIDLVSNESDSLEIPREVEKEFEKVAHNGVSYQMCKRIGTILPEDFTTSTNSDDFGSIPIYPELKRSGRFRRSAPAQGADQQLLALVNGIVDTALAGLVNNLSKRHQYKIKIPNVYNKKFKVAAGSIFESYGYLDAINGHFSDLTTLKKTKNVEVGRKGDKLMADTGFGLTSARFDYNLFKVRYGPVEVKGKLVADIDGFAISSKITVDYGRHPCKTRLEKFQISEFGNIKITVHGLGALDDLTSHFMTWVTKNWKQNISKLIEKKGKMRLQEEIGKINCEKFRPF
ncbi:uncharacterized protein LOC117169904 [Belonocnema kinseyi]|uniref:uncharacterized protein LOC117169904 n=1 Tax=Belonocnema kinseyi TaxID=2817044 RepID=UPI00143D3F67|nr:uncharacterized protein LOC117169904 [Belonocnema kinseyi]